MFAGVFRCLWPYSDRGPTGERCNRLFRRASLSMSVLCECEYASVSLNVFFVNLFIKKARCRERTIFKVFESAGVESGEL